MAELPVAAARQAMTDSICAGHIDRPNRPDTSHQREAIVAVS
jgi:hypothetical protein